MPTPPAAPVPRSDLSDLVTERLRELILAGELLPGERLVETDLADACGTSRGPVRDAIARLHRSGLVTVVPRRGAYVATFEAGDVEEVYSLRIALESLAVRQAARRGTERDWSAMESALDEIDAALSEGNPTRVGDADMRFHRALVAAAASGRLSRAWNAFADQTLLLLNDLSRRKPSVQTALGGHHAVLAALRDGDGDRAETLLRDHLREACDELVRIVSVAPPAVSPARQ